MAVVYKNAGLFTFAIFALRDSGVKPLGYAIWQAMQFGTLPVILSIFIVIHFKKLYKHKL